MKRPAVFFDRDNTLIACDGYLGDPEGVVLVEGAAELVARVRRLGYAAVTISNQSGVARGMFTEQDVHRVNSRLDEMLLDQEPGAVIDRHEFCPHHPEAVVPRYRQASEFRKPAPGMIYQAARQLDLDLARSWVVGDAPRDVEAGHAAGCRTILIKDPSLVPSEAASEVSSVDPDFVAASLKEVADFIESNQPAEPTPELAPEPSPAIADPPIDHESNASVETVAAPGDAPDDGAAGPAPSEGVADRGISASSAAVAEPSPANVEPAAPEGEAHVGPVEEEASSGVGAQAEQETLPTNPPGGVSTAPVHWVESPEHGATSAAPVEVAIAEESFAETESSAQPAQEQVMQDNSTSGPGSPADADADAPARRRSPPAVILAAKAAREAARHSVPDASAQTLREVARNAAREAALGTTRHSSPSVPESAPAASVPESAAALDPAPVEANEPPSQPAPPGPLDEPTTDAPTHGEPATPAHRATGAAEPTETGAVPAGDLTRLEDITEQILLELRRRNDAGADFSVSKLMAGITMVISLALLVYAYLYKNDPSTLQSLLLLGLMLQSITISLLIMGRQK